MADRLRTIILCGGRGTRMWAHSPEIPKLLIDVAGKPILEHVVRIYTRLGFKDIILALGHRGDLIKNHFSKDLRKRCGVETMEFADTGEESSTGERIRRLRNCVTGTFFTTYGDGVSDIDLTALLRFHRSHGRTATITVIQPNTSFGIAVLNGDRIIGFREKPKLTEWVNGGFFVFESKIFDAIGENEMLEQGPMERLAAAGELMAYRHDGFWQCMDTFKDVLSLNDLCRDGGPPWYREHRIPGGKADE